MEMVVMTKLMMIADDIRALNKQTRESVTQIGTKLMEARELLGHGEVLPWIESEFGWSKSTVYAFINVAEATDKIPNFGNLAIPVSALYLLAAPGTPEEAVEIVIERVEAGEKMSVEDVKAVVEEEKVKRGRGRPRKAKPTTEPKEDAKPEDQPMNNVVSITQPVKPVKVKKDGKFAERNREMGRLHFEEKMGWDELAKIYGLIPKACQDAVSRQRRLDGLTRSARKDKGEAKVIKAKVRAPEWDAEVTPSDALEKAIKAAVTALKAVTGYEAERSYAVARVMLGMDVLSTQWLYPQLKRLDPYHFGMASELTVKL